MAALFKKDVATKQTGRRNTFLPEKQRAPASAARPKATRPGWGHPGWEWRRLHWAQPGPPAPQALAGRALGTILWTAQVPLRLRVRGSFSTARRGRGRPGSPQWASSRRKRKPSQGAGPAPPAPQRGRHGPGSGVYAAAARWPKAEGGAGCTGAAPAEVAAAGRPAARGAAPLPHWRRAGELPPCRGEAELPGASCSQRLREPATAARQGKPCTEEGKEAPTRRRAPRASPGTPTGREGGGAAAAGSVRHPAVGWRGGAGCPTRCGETWCRQKPVLGAGENCAALEDGSPGWVARVPAEGSPPAAGVPPRRPGGLWQEAPSHTQASPLGAGNLPTANVASVDWNGIMGFRAAVLGPGVGCSLREGLTWVRPSLCPRPWRGEWEIEQFGRQHCKSFPAAWWGRWDPGGRTAPCFRRLPWESEGRRERLWSKPPGTSG